MSCEIIAVDFRGTKQVVGSQCVPKWYNWTCDCCHKKYKNTEGSTTNMKLVKIDKDIGIQGQQQMVTFKICQHCCKTFGEVDFGSGDTQDV